MLRGFCDFWKSWCRQLFLRPGRWEPPSYCYGFVPHRRREAAMVGQRAVALRLHALRRPLVDLSLDMRKAFQSVGHDHLDAQAFSRMPAEDAVYFEQKRQRLFLSVPSLGGFAEGRICSGSPMGDKSAPGEFVSAFQAPVAQWHSQGR